MQGKAGKKKDKKKGKKKKKKKKDKRHFKARPVPESTYYAPRASGGGGGGGARTMAVGGVSPTHTALLRNHIPARLDNAWAVYDQMRHASP